MKSNLVQEIQYFSDVPSSTWEVLRVELLRDLWILDIRPNPTVMSCGCEMGIKNHRGLEWLNAVTFPDKPPDHRLREAEAQGATLN